MAKIYALYAVADRMGGIYLDSFDRFTENIEEAKEWLDGGWASVLTIEVEDRPNYCERKIKVNISKRVTRRGDL